MNDLNIDDVAIAKLELLLRGCDNCKFVELIDVSEHSENHDIISICGLTGGSTGKVCVYYDKRKVH